MPSWGDCAVNGPLLHRVPSRATKEASSTPVQVPSGPNRMAAHTRKGIGVATSMREFGPAIGSRPKPSDAVRSNPPPRRSPSATLRGPGRMCPPMPARAHRTMGGTSATLASEALRNHICQLSEKGRWVPASMAAPAPTNEPTRGPNPAAKTRKRAEPRRVSNRGGHSPARRSATAPMSISATLPAKNPAETRSGVPASHSASNSAGRSARMNIHHTRGGESSSADSTMAFVGQMIAIFSGWTHIAMPTRAPTYAAIPVAAAAIRKAASPARALSGIRSFPALIVAPPGNATVSTARNRASIPPQGHATGYRFCHGHGRFTLLLDALPHLFLQLHCMVGAR